MNDAAVSETAAGDHAGLVEPDDDAGERKGARRRRKGPFFGGVPAKGKGKPRQEAAGDGKITPPLGQLDGQKFPKFTPIGHGKVSPQGLSAL